MDDYFKALDNATAGRSFDWSALNIDLDFNQSEIDLDAILSGAKSFTDSKEEMLFIHEYVHFLQLFYCSWGNLCFHELVLFLEKMGGSSLDEKFQIELPAKFEKKVNCEIWNGGIDHYDKFKRLIGVVNEAAPFDNSSVYPKVVIKSRTKESVTFSNGRICYEITFKTVREHMAEMCACLFLNYTDKQIHERFIAASELCSSPGILDKKPMYWMLFEYFYTNSYTNIAEGLVLLCHTSLCTATPTHSIARFLKYIEEADLGKLTGNNLLLMTQTFNIIPPEIIAFSFTWNATFQNLNRQIDLCSKNLEHDFYKYTRVIFLRLITNVFLTYSGKSIFLQPANLRQKNTWLNLIKSTGTPITRYKNKEPVLEVENKEIKESLTYFLGFSKILENLQNTKTDACPFHTEFDICKADYRDSNRCLHEPLKVKNPKNNGKECHYQNCIELIGLKQRLNNYR